MIRLNQMPNISYMTPPARICEPLRCIYCGDDELAQVRNLKGEPVHHRKSGEWLYVCGTCGEEAWM